MFKKNTFHGLLFTLLILPLHSVALEPLSVFPGAKVIASTDFEAAYYRLALGPQKKINNVWRAEQSNNYRGQLRRLTQELPAEFTRAEVLSYYEDALSLANTARLYDCSGRDCGSSNSWANSHFNIKQLYGLDQAQNYRAYKVSESELLVFYLVRRGNKRLYMQIEQLIQVK